MKGLFLPVVLATTLILSACTTVPDNQPTPQAQYQAAMSLVKRGQYDEAIQQFEKLKSNAGSTEEEARADMGVVYAYFIKEDYDSVKRLSAQAIQIYPTNFQIAYMYYLRAMAFQKTGEAQAARIMEQVAPGSEYPEDLRTAYAEFAKLIKRYPDSKFSDDSYKNLEFIREQLARVELHIAQYFMLQNDYAEVVKRTRYVNEYYTNLQVRKKALSLLLKAYKQLDQPVNVKRTENELQEVIEKIARQ